MPHPTPHGDKLQAALENDKLPAADEMRVRAAIDRYRAWITELAGIEGVGEDLIEPMVRSLDNYKRFIDLELVFDSPEDFLYRQKGQLKLDNTVIEEFVPWLVGRVLEDRLTNRNVVLGPANCFSQLRFDSHLRSTPVGGGMAVRSKNQDFAMARKLFLKASHQPDFSEALQEDTNIAYMAAEIKTNLDKTMFQEAAATAYDLKLAVPSSQYFLLCEWLDMTPISTSVTAIEEVIILRKAKRLSSNIRKNFSSAAGRAAARDQYQRFLLQHPFSFDAFSRLISHVDALLGDGDQSEGTVLGRGWF